MFAFNVTKARSFVEYRLFTHIDVSNIMFNEDDDNRRFSAIVF